jgi:hypothetical protein
MPPAYRESGRTILAIVYWFLQGFCGVPNFSEQPRENKWCPEEDSNLHASRR